MFISNFSKNSSINLLKERDLGDSLACPGDHGEASE
jgi:hypothetical protein